MNKRQFIKSLSALAAANILPNVVHAEQGSAYDFYFTRLSYESGDWEVDERMPANVLNSLIEYTSLRVDIKERIIPLSDPQMLNSPFCYMAGHRLVQFNHEEKQNFKTYVENGGFVFVDDCNHDIDGMFARTFEKQMAEMFGEHALKKIPNDHAIYSSFFTFDGPPRTSIELNGWGDDLVHNYLKAIEINGRIAVLYSNKDLGCEWDYDFRNKRWLKVDNTRFAVNIVIYSMTS
ncbi:MULTISPECIES: DUF4159 domain-containing protein [Thalassotalea]|uniref:DUF4159 domain-containing protein n=1 Tax=Thalassotalea castellviae TaxID=3075612 RepID=A0ABU3A3Q5_9GAMM|nr:DUF4159 domain-containing protein [Thalassotalea sp. W431]MDT0604810.1 DUF4159 domain-containing protein [Thalassotalea sp. W431]